MNYEREKRKHNNIFPPVLEVILPLNFRHLCHSKVRDGHDLIIFRYRNHHRTTSHLVEISFWAIQKFQTDIACLKLSEYLPSSVVEFVLPHHIASLIRGGAKAGPWRNEELCPSGTPSKDDEATTPPTARKSSPFEREKVVICSIKNNSYNNMIIVKLTAIKKKIKFKKKNPLVRCTPQKFIIIII